MRQHENWFQIRHELYEHIRARVQQRMGREAAELRGYRAALDKEFGHVWRASSTKDLLVQVERSDLVFMADFHALRQSQKTHLRILKKVSAGQEMILAVECIPASKQKEVDAFLRGEMNEEVLVKRVKWYENWGFPWENYAPLFRWAQENKVPVYGINMDFGKNPSMRLRDRFAAKKIQEIKERNPQSKIFVIYGDLHLAEKHLPKHFEKSKLKTMRILQNSEKIYFKALRRNPGDEVEVVRRGKGSFCVLNVPPWVKWQNYLMFLEQTYDSGLDDNIDCTDHVLAFVRLLAKELQVKVDYSDLSVYTAADTNFWDKITESTSKKERAWIADIISEEGVFYLPGLRLGYLPRASVNHAAALAMEYILCKASGLKNNLLVMPDDFMKWIWINGWSYFGSKLINPKRKSETLIDIRSRLTSREGGLKREPLQLALSHKIFELMMVSQGILRPGHFKPRLKSSYVIAAELLGGIMGERIYAAYIRKKISSSRLRQLISTDLEAEDFQENYFQFVRFLERIPLSFKSKEEKI